MAQYVLTNVFHDYGEIILNRQERRNSFNAEYLKQLNTAIEQLKTIPSLKAIILKSSNPEAFCSGVDLSVLESFNSPGEARQFALLLEETMLHLFQFPLPVIAAINGFAYGGGFGLAMAGDLRLINKSGEIRFPAVKIGAILPISCTIRLNFLIGLSKSKELLLTGRVIKAEESVEMGLTNFAGTEQEIVEKIKMYVQQFRNANREALILQKIALNQTVVAEMAKYSVQSAENFAYLYASGFWKDILKKMKRPR